MDISNEQKAKEIAENIVGNCHYSYFDDFKLCALQAMEWKDKELKNYLDELLAKLNACEKDRTREATIVEIIIGHFF